MTVPFLDRLNNFDVILAVLADGSFAVAGSEASPVGPHEIERLPMIQFFGPDGHALGAPVLGPGQVDSLGTLGDRYFVTWSQEASDSSPNGWETKAAVYSREGFVLGQVVDWPDPWGSRYRYGHSPGWEFVRIIFRLVGQDSFGNKVYEQTVRVYDRQLSSVGAPYVPSLNMGVADAAINGLGARAFTVVECPACDPGCQQLCASRVILFDSHGQTVGRTEEVRHDSSVAIDNEGRVFLASAVSTGPRESLAVAQLYDSSGRSISPEIAVTGLRVSEYPVTYSLSNGELLLVLDHIDSELSAKPESVFVAEFDRTRQVFLPPVLLASLSTAGYFSSFGYLVKINDSGAGLVIWQTINQDGSYAGHMRLFTVEAENPCTADASHLCLSDGRFEVSTRWHTSDGRSGAGRAVGLSGDTGYFWFFGASNVEMVVKALNGCGLNGHFWFFAGGLTNVGVTTTVRDSLTGEVKVYENQLGVPFAPIQDTSAFDACP